MRGRCNHCDVEYPVEDLAGYNVRYGQITKALCNSCVSMLGGAEGVAWFERLQARVSVMQQRKARSTALPWQQTKLDVSMNSAEEE